MFSVIRSYGGNANQNPSALQFNYRVARIVQQIICDDEHVSPMDLKPHLPRPPIAQIDQTDTTSIQIPVDFRQSESDGLTWIAGRKVYLKSK